MMSRLWMTAALVAWGCGIARAEVKLPAVLADHMVLQRGGPIHVWGWATPGAGVTVKLHGQQAMETADALGKWSVYLKPESAGGPYEMTVSGDGGETTLHDVLVGDVWVASGQSNMEMPLNGFGRGTQVKDAEKEIAAATNPRLRLMVVTKDSSDTPLTDLKGTWTQCTPETARNFSAVAYFFGREIAAREKVPVGLIDSTWGGTPADSWVSLDTLGSDASLLPAFASRAALADREADALLPDRQDAANRAAVRSWLSSWQPAGLYNAMIAPLTPLAIKGVIWYQGETNSSTERAPYYRALFGALIHDWRMHFAQGMFPFLYVQISSFESPSEHWGLLRDQQRRTLAVTNTGMAVSLDVGTPGNVHPPDKQTVGDRLARAARAMTYGEHVAYEGPLFREATTEQGEDGATAMRVWFDHAEGLTFRGLPAQGFEVAGADHRFFPGQARVEGETVVVRSEMVKTPRYVRYGWTSVVPVSLYNAAGLPTSTFSSEPVPTP